MLAVVPLIAFGLLGLGLRRRGLPWRPAVLGAAIGWGVVVVLITEGLSLVRAVTLPGVMGAWLVACIAAGVVLARGRRAAGPAPSPGLETRAWPAEAWLLVPVAGIAAALGLLGVTSAPNNFDSMTYHMSRVAHWVQNASVAHYPTHVLRQVYQTPWAEYALLQMQVACGGDRCANLVQWFAMVGSVVGVSWIARELGAGPRGQILAAVLCATIPLGLLEAASTQNDYVLAFWLVCLAACVLSVARDAGGETVRRSALAAGAALGLALLTKGTAYLLALPFVVWLGLALWRRRRRRALPTLVAAGVLAVTLNVPHYGRNVATFGQPLGPGMGPGVPYLYTNQVFSVGATVSNALRNLALELGTPSWSVNIRLGRAVRGAHGWLGLDADDPRTTFAGERFVILAHLWDSENVTASLLHTLLVLATLATVLVSRAARRPSLVAYLVTLTAGFGLLSFYVAWTPWNNRLLLPLLVLWCPAIGVVMEHAWSPRLAAMVAAGLLALSAAWVVASAGHPLVGPRSVLHLPRSEQYLLRAPAFRDPFLQVAALARERRCDRIGLVMGWNDVEYPLWALLGDGGARVRIEHVEVRNASARAGAGAPFAPCLVVAIGEGQRVRVEVRE